MRKLFTAFAMMLLSATFLSQQAGAQSPGKMSYQAVIRNSSNQLVTNQPVGFQISILQGSANGTVVYTETQTPTTNANGLISIEVGGGAGFDVIDWANGPYFLKTEIDPTGGTSYTITGISQLLSVPFALHANTADSIKGGVTESDPVFTAWDKSSGISIAENQISDLKHFTNADEVDPHFSTSVASNISASDTARWSNKLDSYTETDPHFSTSVASNISASDTTRWSNKSDFNSNYTSLTNAPDIANTTSNKTITLNTNDNTSSLNVTNSSSATVFKVDGSGRMTGDGSGLSNVRPVAAYAGGNYYFKLTSNDPYNPNLIKYVQLTVSGPGVIIVQATGYVGWESMNVDYLRASIIDNSIALGSPTFGNNYFSYLMLVSDFNCADSVDQYSSWSTSRTFVVSTAGTYRYNLWADKAFSSCGTALADVNMSAIYIPTGGTGMAKSPALREEELAVPKNVNSISGD